MNEESAEPLKEKEEIISLSSNENSNNRTAELLKQWIDEKFPGGITPAARAIGVQAETLKGYVKGSSITFTNLGSILKAFDPPTPQAEEFATCVRSELVLNGNREWLSRKIANKQWEDISFPSLDYEWLQQQPAHLQPGLVIKDLLSRKKSSQLQLETILNVSDRTVGFWVNGERCIGKERVNLCNAICDTDSEKEYLSGIITGTESAVEKNAAQTLACLRSRKIKGKGSSQQRIEVLPEIETGGEEGNRTAAPNYLYSRCNILMAAYNAAVNEAPQNGSRENVNAAELEMLKIIKALEALRKAGQGSIFNQDMCKRITSLDTEKLPPELRKTYLTLLDAAIKTNPAIITQSYIEPFTIAQRIGMAVQKDMKKMAGVSPQCTAQRAMIQEIKLYGVQWISRIAQPVREHVIQQLNNLRSTEAAGR